VAALRDNWGEARGGGTREHHAIDIMAPMGTAVVAAMGGRVERIFDSVPGGHTVYIRSPDGGTVYYYAHLDSYARGLREGMAVSQGQFIASVGATGDADAAAPHLHFEVKRMQPGERWWQGTNINPYPLLMGVRH
jgi:murein DD-endopeptidase MepM/ murein hydrolase activator NlpD